MADHSKQSRNGNAAPAAPERLVVLLVDDQALVDEAVRRMLADQPDIELHYHSKALDAVDVAAELGPTVILQDLVMPDLDGLALIPRYRADWVTRDIPIIVLSSKEDAAVKRDAFLSGASDYLVKLPDPIELVARIRLHGNAYFDHLQKDDFCRRLGESEQRLATANQELASRVGELQQARDELSRLVSTDSLSGIFSRRRWLELASAEFARHKRYGSSPFTILTADLDFFKQINDTHGHAVGDEVIRQFGALLRAVGRQSDAAGRLGGEEFAMLLTETSAAGAETVARRIVTDCRDLRIPVAGTELQFSCSVGGTTATPADQSMEQVLQRADAALYEAKRNGRSCWRFA
jgi:two-component system chemotaxis family response regulator WspR